MVVYMVEQRWEILIQIDADFGKKKLFHLKIILILAGMSTSKIVACGTQTLFGADFGPQA